MLSLQNGEVHLWQTRVDSESLQESDFLGALSRDEQTRANRFRFPKDRDQYIVGRSMTRAVLGCYIGCNPHEIRFCYSSYGKPGLPADFQTDLHFNLSHSEQLVLLAITYGSEIGVDVEFMRSNVVNGALAEKVFSAQEIATFHVLPLELKHRAFFNGWTRKEAFIKAMGEGLSMPLDRFDVSIHPVEPAKLLSIRPDPAELERWSLRDLELAGGYVGAIVVGKQDWHLRRFAWPALDVDSSDVQAVKNRELV
jgi:4'-phosphopantetheinyl transferase